MNRVRHPYTKNQPHLQTIDVYYLEPLPSELKRQFPLCSEGTAKTSCNTTQKYSIKISIRDFKDQEVLH